MALALRAYRESQTCEVGEMMLTKCEHRISIMRVTVDYFEIDLKSEYRTRPPDDDMIGMVALTRVKDDPSSNQLGNQQVLWHVTGVVQV